MDSTITVPEGVFKTVPAVGDKLVIEAEVITVAGEITLKVGKVETPTRKAAPDKGKVSPAVRAVLQMGR